MGPTRKSFLLPQLPERKRLCYPILLAAGIRIIGAAWLYQTLTIDGRFHTPWMDANPNLIPAPLSWPWLFNAWDSLQFPRIAMYGYFHPNYVYLPGYPILILLAGRLTGNFWFGAFLITQLFALGSIVVFQLLAEEYMPSNQALYATLLMTAFPYISVFTTLGYSEAIFFFSTLSAWYFYKKGRILSSALLTGLASITRIYGLLILLPMILDIIKTKQHRRVLYLTIPLVFVSAWLFFCYLSTGDPFVSWTDEKYWYIYTGGVGNGIQIAEGFLQHGLRGLMNCCGVLDPSIFWALSLFVILIVLTWKVDRLLWVYAATVSGILLLSTSYSLSLLRYLAFIFPIWLNIRVKNRLVVAIGVGILVLLTIVVWLYTIALTFVG